MLVHVLKFLKHDDLGRLAQTCRAFASTPAPLPRPLPPIEQALRLRAALQRYPLPHVLPPGETTWTKYLLWLEKRRADDRQMVAVGASHGVVTDTNGRLFTCGTETSRQLTGDATGVLGQGAGMMGLCIPKLVASMASVRVYSVAAGRNHSLALSWTGEVYSWGCGLQGVLGHGDQVQQVCPRQISALKGSRVQSIAAGRLHSLAATREGVCFTWGSGAYGQLGHGSEDDTFEPIEMTTFGNQVHVVAIAAGSEHSLFTTRRGEMFACGYAVQGQLGIGRPVQASHSLPQRVLVPSSSHITDCAAGACHSLCCDSEGKAYVWGDMGLRPKRHKPCDPLTPVLKPVRLNPSEGLFVTKIASGSHHSIMKAQDGSVYTIGNGALGRLGLGNNLSKDQPTRVNMPDEPSIHSVACGCSATMAISSSGNLYGWGAGEALGLPHSQFVPVAISY